MGVRYPRTVDELIREWEHRKRESDAVYAHGDLLVQERIPGEVHDVGALCNRGRWRAALTVRRILMHPPSGGFTVFAETTDDPELRRLALTLLEALSWHGPADVEFKRDARDGRFKLMEINARY